MTERAKPASRTFKSAEEVLDFAIDKEEEGYRFYIDWMVRIARTDAVELFERLALDELRHKAKLEAIKHAKLAAFVESVAPKVPNLRIVDYMPPANPRTGIGYQHALAVAVTKERRALKLYSNLALWTSDRSLHKLFIALAREEEKHRLRLELEIVLRDR